MSVDDLLDSVQIVTDNTGGRRAVLLDWVVWEEIRTRLQRAERYKPSHRQAGEDNWDLAMEREEAAYLRLHKELVKSYAGQNVAIAHEQLVDHDPDGAVLYLRMRQQFPGEFVLITPVLPQPEEEYVVYSPRLVARAHEVVLSR